MRTNTARPTLHHTAIAVHDLDRAVAFYTTHFGGEVEVILQDVGDPNIAELHLLPAARFTLAFVRFGSTRLEFFQFAEPADGREIESRAHDFGIRHIAFETDDLQSTYDRLSAAGVDSPVPRTWFPTATPQERNSPSALTPMATALSSSKPVEMLTTLSVAWNRVLLAARFSTPDATARD